VANSNGRAQPAKSTGATLPENALKAFVLLVVGLQSSLIFGETDDVNWAAGVPLALGSAAGAYVASLFATQEWAKVWVYRFLVLLVILSIVHLLMVDSSEFLSRNSNPTYYW
jgi:uncharacterized membrane protein YfcA